MKNIARKRKNRFIHYNEENNSLIHKKRDKNINLDSRDLDIYDFSWKAFIFSCLKYFLIIILFLILIIFLAKSFNTSPTTPHKNVTKYKKYSRTNTLKDHKVNYYQLSKFSIEDAFIKSINYLKESFLEKLIRKEFDSKIINETKISVIIPVYNNEKIIKSVIRSVQNQKMDNIEIIVVDDYSKDNTNKMIEELKQEDYRVKLISNNKKKGLLYSRCIGVLEAKGKYIINLNSIDLIMSEDIFNDVYYLAENELIDIVAFSYIESVNYDFNIKGIKEGIFMNKIDNLKMNQPRLSTMIIKNYNNYFSDTLIWGKLIKTSIYKKSIDYLGAKIYNEYNDINENMIQLFAIYYSADSYKRIRKYGIYHIIQTLPFSEDDIIYMQIYFSELIFNLAEIGLKKYSINIINDIKKLNETNKIYYKSVVQKIMNNPYIDEQYKRRIKLYNNLTDFSILNKAF